MQLSIRQLARPSPTRLSNSRLSLRLLLRQSLHFILIGLLMYSPISAASTCLMQEQEKFDLEVENAHCDDGSLDDGILANGNLNEQTHHESPSETSTPHHSDDALNECDCQCSFCTHTGVAVFLDFSGSRFSSVNDINPYVTKLPVVYLARLYPPPIY